MSEFDNLGNQKTYTFRVGVRMTGPDRRRKITVEAASDAEADAKARDLLDEYARSNDDEAPVRWDLELCLDKRHIWRAGDVVRIVKPKFVERVGYLLVWPMLMEEFRKHPNVHRTMVELGLIKDQTFPFGATESGNSRYDKLRDEFLRGVCMASVRSRAFGGNVRSIHYLDESHHCDYYKGTEAQVMSRRSVKTGTRFAAWSGQSYEGEYDYEPGGLSDEVTHTLLKLDNGFEIEAANIELVKAVEPMYYIRNTSSVVGNSILWWAEGGHGYTCDLKKAWKVTESKARDVCRSRPEQDVMVPANKAEKSTELHVDSQRFPMRLRRTRKQKPVDEGPTFEECEENFRRRHSNKEADNAR